MGHSFDALAKYKATTDKLDKFLIYQAQNGGLNGGPSYVFKTSEAQLHMALDMDRDAEGILKHEVCFVDGNHKRCPGYITLTLWVRINLWQFFLYIYQLQAYNNKSKKNAFPHPLKIKYN